MKKGIPISIEDGFKKVKFLDNRAPESSDEDKKDAFANLSEYRDGAIFIAHSAGNTEWERHSKGDEIVFVLEGETNLILLVQGEEKLNNLKVDELLVVPQNIWHRFETPKGAKVLTVTPLPTDHSIEYPKDA
jgi:quercetin dioxygenase-like cupin family protein